MDIVKAADGTRIHQTIHGMRKNRVYTETERTKRLYFPPELENLVTDLVPSEMACFDSSPGRIKRTEVCISRDEMVDFLEYEASSTV
jgi:hypothetical protein